jgi:hypothetical protein
MSTHERQNTTYLGKISEVRKSEAGGRARSSAEGSGSGGRELLEGEGVSGDRLVAEFFLHRASALVGWPCPRFGVERKGGCGEGKGDSGSPKSISVHDEGPQGTATLSK